MTKYHKLSNLKTNIFSHSSGASSERKVMSVGFVFYRGLALWLFPFQLAIFFFHAWICLHSVHDWGFPGDTVVMNLPASAGLGWSPGVGNDCPLQDACLGCCLDKEAWQATVHGVIKSQTWLLDWAHPHSSCLCPDLPVFYFYFKYTHTHTHTHTHIHTYIYILKFMMCWFLPYTMQISHNYTYPVSLLSPPPITPGHQITWLNSLWNSLCCTAAP